MAKIRSNVLKEPLRMRDPFQYWYVRVYFRRVSVHLPGIEHAIAASEQQAGTAGGVLAITLGLAGIVGKLPKHYQSGLFTFADLHLAFLPLRIRGPLARLIPFGLRSGPQTYCVDSPIGFLACDVDRRERIAPVGMPRHARICYALLDCGDNLGRD